MDFKRFHKTWEILQIQNLLCSHYLKCQKEDICPNESKTVFKIFFRLTNFARIHLVNFGTLPALYGAYQCLLKVWKLLKFKKYESSDCPLYRHPIQAGQIVQHPIQAGQIVEHVTFYKNLHKLFKETKQFKRETSLLISHYLTICNEKRAKHKSFIKISK